MGGVGGQFPRNLVDPWLFNNYCNNSTGTCDLLSYILTQLISCKNHEPQLPISRLCRFLYHPEFSLDSKDDAKTYNAHTVYVSKVRKKNSRILIDWLWVVSWLTKRLLLFESICFYFCLMSVSLLIFFNYLDHFDQFATDKSSLFRAPR